MSLSELAKPYYSPAEIASILNDCGYKAEVAQLKSGRPVIRSATAGYNFSIYTYGPQDEPDHINTIQFTTAFAKKKSLEAINTWNYEKRFIKAYSDNDGDLCVDWDVVVKFVAPAFIKECIEFWELVLGDIGKL